MTHSGRITSSIGVLGLIQDVNYLYLVVGPFSLLACLAALLSAFNLLLMCLSSCSSWESSTAGRRARFSGILSSKRRQRCLYGQAQELKLCSRVYYSISARSRERSGAERSGAERSALVGPAVWAKANAATTEL